MANWLSTRRKYLSISGSGALVGLSGCLLPSSSTNNEENEGTDQGDSEPQEENDSEPQEEDDSEPQDELVQEFEFSAQNTFEETPAVSNGIIIAPNTDRNLYVIDIESGGSLWSFEFNDAMSATPAVGDNSVFTNSELNNGMYSFDLNSGDENWSKDPDHDLHQDSPAYNGEYVFVSDSGVKAYNAATGNHEWDYDYDGRLYVSSKVHLTNSNAINVASNEVFAVDQDSGTEQWTFQGPGDPSPDSLTTNENRVIFSDGSDTVYILDSQSGDSIHQISTSRTVSDMSVIDGVLYYVDDDLKAFDLDTMDELWESDSSISELSENTLDGYLFGTHFSGFAGVDISTGDEVLNHEVSTRRRVRPVIAGNYVVIPDDSNSLIGYQITASTN